jgi:hypothetical protein
MKHVSSDCATVTLGVCNSTRYGGGRCLSRPMRKSEGYNEESGAGFGVGYSIQRMGCQMLLPSEQQVGSLLPRLPLTPAARSTRTRR